MVTHILYGDNYTTWSRAMIKVFGAKNKIGFANASLLCPSTVDHSFQVWSRCNHMIYSWILNSITKDIVFNIVYAIGACNMWDDL